MSRRRHPRPKLLQFPVKLETINSDVAGQVCITGVVTDLARLQQYIKIYYRDIQFGTKIELFFPIAWKQAEILTFLKQEKDSNFPITGGLSALLHWKSLKDSSCRS